MKDRYLQVVFLAVAIALVPLLVVTAREHRLRPVEVPTLRSEIGN